MRLEEREHEFTMGRPTSYNTGFAKPGNVIRNRRYWFVEVNN